MKILCSSLARRARLTSLVHGIVAALLLFALTERSAHAQMSETEKKAAARAAYQEGVKLQDDGKAEEALKRFEAAEKLYDAPTHLLHIAECQALTGRLVEASETYETLDRKVLPAGSPDAFTQAQQQGQAELPPLRARIPSLRVTTKPGPQQIQRLSVNVNGVNMPIELLGIARPLNPGTYRLSAQGVGWSTASSVDVPLAEKEQKSIELTLRQVAVAGSAVPPPPPPYVDGKVPDGEKPKAKPGPTSFGMLLGVHAGVVVPTGSISKTTDIDQYATVGGGGGLDGYFRLAKMLLLGATFEYASLGTPKTSTAIPNQAVADVSTNTTYVGVNLGILPNVDKVSFIGDVGLGSRTASQNVKINGVSSDSSVHGLDFDISVGLSIPAGPIRIVPKLGLSVGSFSKASDSLGGVTSSTALNDDDSDSATHTFVFFGIAAFYNINFGAKPEPQ